jgi:hypothetical protein
MVFLHVMRPVNQAGAQHSLSPMKADGGAVMNGTRRALCAGVDINQLRLV